MCTISYSLLSKFVIKACSTIENKEKKNLWVNSTSKGNDRRRKTLFEKLRIS